MELAKLFSIFSKKINSENHSVIGKQLDDNYRGYTFLHYPEIIMRPGDREKPICFSLFRNPENRKETRFTSIRY